MGQVKFAVFTDLHYDHIHDADRRVSEFVNGIKGKNLDFIIGLGDICYPIEENKFILDELRKVGVPCYFTIGNHDSDAFSRDITVDFLGMPNNYYSFTRGKVKFIVLDSCYIRKENTFEPYYKRNYNKTLDDYPYLPTDELEWLLKELNDTCEYYILFSHHSLANEFVKRGIANRNEARSILENKNVNKKRVLLCMNGHDHGDAVREINGIYYYTLNSMSYIWHGMKETYNYSQEIHKKYPYIKDMILYQEGMHAIVTVSDDGHIRIEGMKGHYQNISPDDIGIGNTWNGVSIKPVVSSLNI